MSPLRLALVGVLLELCYLAFYCCGEGPGEVLLFIAVNAITYLILSYLIWRLKSESSVTKNRESALILVIAFGVLFRLTLVPHPPVASDDIFRYLWDGRVASAGINPFSYLPTDSHLAHLATSDLPAKVNHPEMRTLYPALAEGFFFLANRLFGESAAGLKFLLVIADSLTMVLLWRLIRRSGSSVMPLLLYAWSPLPILYFGLDGHVDALGIPFLILFLVYFVTNRQVRGAVALGLSVLAKLVPLILVPLMVRSAQGARRLLLLAVPVLMAVVGYLLYLDPSWGFVDSLKMFAAQWEFNGSIFSIVYFLTGSNETGHQVSAVLIVIYIGVLALVNRPIIEKVFWAFVGFILLSPVVHPWYLTWIAALLVVRWSTAVFVFLGLSNVANIVVYQFKAFGQWNDQPLLLLLEYVPVAILLAREIAQKDVLRSAEPETSLPVDH